MVDFGTPKRGLPPGRLSGERRRRDPDIGFHKVTFMPTPKESETAHTVLFCWEGPQGTSGRVALPLQFADELMRAFADMHPRQRMWVEEPPEIPGQKVARRSKVLRDQ
jgi:hypothetical protein